MKVKLQNVRLAFPKLFKAEQVNGEGDPQFSATFILPKNHPNVPDIERAIEQVARDKWADKADAVLKKIKLERKTCLNDGDLKADLDGYAGNLYINANNKTRPYVIDRDKTQLNPDDGTIYAGCYVYAVIDVWAMDNNFGKRVCASLSGVQFYRDGDAFASSGIASADDFDDLSVDSEEEFSV